MGTSLPPGVFKGEFTFSPKPEVHAATVKSAVQKALQEFAAPNTEVDVQVEYQPIR